MTVILLEEMVILTIIMIIRIILFINRNNDNNDDNILLWFWLMTLMLDMSSCKTDGALIIVIILIIPYLTLAYHVKYLLHDSELLASLAICYSLRFVLLLHHRFHTCIYLRFLRTCSNSLRTDVANSITDCYLQRKLPCYCSTACWLCNYSFLVLIIILWVYGNSIILWLQYQILAGVQL